MSDHEMVPPYTMVSLKEYIDTRLEAIDRAIQTADAVLSYRLAGMNEFRDAMKDQALRFALRDEVEKDLAAIRQDIRYLREAKAEMDGKASWQALVFSTLVALSGVVLGIIAVILQVVR